MNSLQLGFLILSGERLAIILAACIFMLGSGLLATRVSEGFNRWSTVVVFAGLAAARLGHVISYWPYFSDDPLRILAIWQGGFQWLWMLPVIVIATLTLLKSGRERAWAMAPVAISALAWVLALQLAPRTEPLPAPSMMLEQVDGPAILLSQSHNAPTVINLWASWCPPCRREMPALEQAQKLHPDVRFLFINQGESEAKIRDYIQQEGLGLKPLLRDPQMQVPDYYKTPGLPVTLFLNRDGSLRHVHTGEIAPEEIARQIRRLE